MSKKTCAKLSFKKMGWALSNIQRPLHRVSAMLSNVTEAVTGGAL